MIANIITKVFFIELIEYFKKSVFYLFSQIKLQNKKFSIASLLIFLNF